MKLAILFLFMAVGAYSQPFLFQEIRPALYDSCLNSLITLEAKNQELHTVLHDIERHANSVGCYVSMSFCYAHIERINVSIDKKKRTILETVYTVLQGTNLSFKVINKHFIIIYKP